MPVTLLTDEATVEPEYDVKFWLEAGLYQAVEHTMSNNNNVVNVNGTINAFCVKCNDQSVFSKSGFSAGKILTHHNIQSNAQIVLNCARNSSHQISLFFRFENSEIIKVGQYPTHADLVGSKLRKYLPILGKERMGELNRSVGLISHGVGTGAFVYLRRIFESLIFAAKDRYAEFNENWDEGKFQAARMNEKIEILKNDLPSFLVENQMIYGILSKGVHELSDKSCIEAFPTVLLGIELILDDELEKHERQKKIDAAKASIAALGGKIKRNERE